MGHNDGLSLSEGAMGDCQEDLALLSLTVLNSVAAAISRFSLDAEGRRVESYWSPGCRGVYGYSAATFLSQPQLWRSRIHPQDWEQVVQPLYETVGSLFPAPQPPVPTSTRSDAEPEGVTRSIQFRFFHPDQTYHWILATLSIEPCVGGWAVTSVDLDLSGRPSQDAPRLDFEFGRLSWPQSCDLSPPEQECPQALIQSRQSLVAQVINSSPNLIFVKDSDGRYLFVNQALADLHGLLPEDLLGKIDTGLFADEEMRHRIRQENLRVILHQESLLIPEEQLGERWFQWFKQPINLLLTRVEQGSEGIWQREASPSSQIPWGVLGIGVDITERKQAEQNLQSLNHQLEALNCDLGSLNRDLEQRVEDRTAALQAEVWNHQRTEALYRNIFDYALDGIFQTTLTGSFINANPALAQFFGYESPNQLITEVTQIGEQLYVDPQRRLEMCRILDEKGSVSKFESPVYRRDGQIIWISENVRMVYDDDGSPLYLEGMVRDITMARKTEAALIESELRFQEVAANLPGMIYRHRLDPHGPQEYTYVSPGCRELTGLEPEQLLQNPASFESLLHPDDGSVLKSCFSNVLSGSIQGWEAELRLLTPQGEHKWVRMTELPRTQLHSDGSLICSGVMVDITERKRTEVEREKAERQLLKRERCLATLVECQTLLWSAKGSDRFHFYSQVLPRLGATVEASRVYIFENHRDREGYLLTSQRAEWCEEGIHSELNNPDYQNIPYHHLSPTWQQLGQQRINARVSEMNSPEREMLKDQGVLAVLAFPLWVQGDFFGFIGFDNCRESRLWDPPEVDFLDAAAKALSVRLERQQIDTTLQLQQQQTQLVADLTLKIQNSLQLDDILRTTVTEIQSLILADRVLIYRILPQRGGCVVAEAKNPNVASLLGLEFELDHCPKEFVRLYERGNVHILPDIEDSGLPDCLVDQMRQVQVKSKLVTPILSGDQPWGLLIAHHCQESRGWSEFEINLLPQLADQLGLAIAQRQLLTSLRQSEERFRELVENLNEVFYVTSADLSQMLYISPAYERIWMRSCQSLYDNTAAWFEALYPEDQPIILANLQRMVEGEAAIGEYRIVRPDGSLRWIRARNLPIYGSDGTLLRHVGLAEDITSQKETEMALRRSEGRLKALVDNLPFEVWAKDTQNRIVFQNAISLKTWGSHLGEDAFSDPSHPGLSTDLPRWQAEDQQALSGDVVLSEDRIVHQGQFRAFSKILAPIRIEQIIDGILGVKIDVTEQTTMAEALREREAFFRSVFENSPIGMTVVSCQGRILRANPFLCQMLHYSESQLVGMDQQDLFYPEDQERGRRWFAQALAGETAQTVLELRFVSRLQGIRWGRCSLTLIRDPLGTPLNSVQVIEDITESRQLEQAKNEFMAMVSHEVRTPLTSIRGSLAMLATGQLGLLEGRGQRMLEIASQQTDRLVRLVNDILNFERLRLGRVDLKAQAHPVQSLFEQAVEPLTLSAQKMEVTLWVQPTEAWIRGDADRILQTLINLVGNAIKFSPPASQITLFCQQQPEQVILHIQDQGRGIPLDKQRLIFEPFQQVDSSDARLRGGTGLGLSICRSIVEQHGGQIWVNSEPGRGSCFSFSLPKADPPL